MPLNRVRVALTGVSGLPGVATFHFGSSVTDMTALRTFWDAIKIVFPNTMSIGVPNSGDTIVEDSGQISGAWSGPAQAAVQGTGGVGAYLSTAGAMVRWTTPQVVNGRPGPDYLVSRRLRLSLTSSWGTTLPALISAKPLSMPARKRTRSSISSQVAESGSSWIALRAMFLLVMLPVYPGRAGHARDFGRG